MWADVRSHWVKLDRAVEHIDALDESVERWLANDPYSVREEHGPYIHDRALVLDMERISFVLQIKEPYPPKWLAVIGDIGHNLRSALDNLAFALNTKGYANANNGATLPPDAAKDSEFPIFGNQDAKGNTVDGRVHFASQISRKVAHVPPLARRIIEDVQPYKRGQDWRTDPLWLAHDPNRFDKHRDGIVSAVARETLKTRNFRLAGYFTDLVWLDGALDDGDEVVYWAMDPERTEATYELDFTFAVAFGKATAISGWPLVPTLRDLSDYIRTTVVAALDGLL